jgi:hypothetical protein
MRLITILLLLFCCVSSGFAVFDDQAAVTGDSMGSPPNIGNFALPSPQQPGPLMAFGQTLIGKNYLQLSAETFSLFPSAAGGAFDNINAAMTYGLTDNTSLFFNYPIEADYQARIHRITGLKDITLQLEHAFYTSGNVKYQEQATVLGYLSLPTQESDPNQVSPVGFGSSSFFVGATYNRTYVDWLVFASPGMLITNTSNHVRLGSQYLYQAGIGHNIFYVTNESMVFGLVEMTGQYTEKDRLFGIANPNSGGNVISLTPSFWLSTKKLIIQAGVGFPVVQNLYGTQPKTDYFIITNVTWTIG